MDTETLQIHLSSKDAMYFDNSISNCQWSLPNIEVPLQHQILISVQHAVIPYTFYNIDQYNNRLDYTINGITTTLFINYGNYNPYSLITYLQSNIPYMTITYSVITNKFTFQHANYDFSFLSTSNCFALIGIPINTTTTSSSKTLTSPNCINLQSHMCLCLSTDLPTGHINNSNKYHNNILCSIPIEGNPFSMITYTNYNNLKSNLFKNTLSTIQIKLIDQNNNLLELNGCHWSVTVQLDVVRFVY
jgi:hypothetical protein